MNPLATAAEWLSLPKVLEDDDLPPGGYPDDFIGRPSTIASQRRSGADQMRGGVAATEGPNAHVHSMRVANSETSEHCITIEEYRKL